jgi:hypothetical protein
MGYLCFVDPQMIVFSGEFGDRFTVFGITTGGSGSIANIY